MLKTYIELSEGRVLSSGVAGEDAVVSVSFTQSVNSAQELTVGSVCANMLEIKLFGSVSVSAGDRLRVWRQDDEVNTYPLGVFIAEKPTRTGSFLNLTAYDPVAQLDQDITALFRQEDLWPCSLQVLAEEICGFCGLTLVGEELPLGQLPVAGISGEGITGRQALGWIGQLTGHFCRATTQGEIEFAWYEENTGIKLGVSSQAGISYADGALTGLSGSYGEGALTLAGTAEDMGDGALALEGQQVIGYYSGSLCFEDYAVAPIEKVQLRKTENDVGAVYPDGLEGSRNTYIVEGNPLLGALPEENLPEVAAHLYQRLQNISYTPCKLSVPANFSVSAGDVVQITHRDGKTITAYVMQKIQSGQKDTLECTGSPQRSATTAVNNRSYTDLQGKVLNLRTDLQGLMAEHSNTAGKLSKLELDMEGIRSQVSNQEELEQKITALEQTAEKVQISVEQIQGEGVDKLKTGMGYTFDDAGLNIHKTDSEITNRLNETGMQVLRNAGTETEAVMLQADAKGVIATDVTVRNYLVIGTHARLEDYGSGRTACFYLGGS